MTNQVIPEAAVEAALSAIFPKGPISEFSRTTWDRTIREALEAAAPHMEPTIKPRDIYRIQATALREAFHEFPLETIAAPDHAAVWMHRRADELERKAENA